MFILRVLMPLVLFSAIGGGLWFVGSLVAGFYNRARLRAAYPAALAAGETTAPDAAAYVAANLPEVNRKTCILIGFLVVGLPASIVGLVLYNSMNH